MNALGHQGRAALAIVPAARLSAMSPREREELIQPAPAILHAPSIDHPAPQRLAKPSIFVAAAVARQRSAQSARMATLEADNAELRGEVAHLSRQLEEAREQGRRDEREVKARTMGGQVLSIFVGSGR